MGNVITYKKTGILGINQVGEHTVEIGQRYNVTREGRCEDMVISRSIAFDCPITVTLLIRTNGDLDVWYVEFSGMQANQYWHFSHMSGDSPHPITDAQRETMIRLRDNIDIYGNLGGNLGADVIKWAFGDEAERVAKAYHD